MTTDDSKEKKQNIKQTILRYLTKSDIFLSSIEEAALSRWEFADLLMRQGITLTENLIQQITLKYAVSRFTADSDIANAMEVFAKSRKVNRKYLGHLHLQDISADLTRIRAKLFEKKATPDSKEINALSKLHDAYTYQLNSLPDELERNPVGKIVMQFSLPGNQQLQAPMTVSNALLMADKILDIEHEDITMENGAAQDNGPDSLGNQSEEDLGGEAGAS